MLTLEHAQHQLPAVVQEFVEVIGWQATEDLIRHLGGISFDFGVGIRDSRRLKILYDIIGQQKTHKLLGRFGGCNEYIPRCDKTFMNKIITIIAGHSNTDPGAVNPRSKTREADIAAEMRNMVAFYLEDAGITVRTDDTGKDNKALCQKLYSAVAKVLKNKIRGDVGYQPENAGQHSRLGYMRNGGIILELFFISNDEELSVWKAKKWLVARAVADVLKSEIKS